MSSNQVAGPPVSGASISGPRTSQISDQHSARRLPERLRMLVPEHRRVGVVVDRDVIRAPPEQDGKAVREEEPDHHPEAGGQPSIGPRAVLDQSLAAMSSAIEELDAPTRPGEGDVGWKSFIARDWKVAGKSR